MLDDIPAAPFTDVMWVKYDDIKSSKYYIYIKLVNVK